MIIVSHLLARVIHFALHCTHLHAFFPIFLVFPIIRLGGDSFLLYLCFSSPVFRCLRVKSSSNASLSRGCHRLAPASHAGAWSHKGKNSLGALGFQKTYEVTYELFTWIFGTHLFKLFAWTYLELMFVWVEFTSNFCLYDWFAWILET